MYTCRTTIYNTVFMSCTCVKQNGSNGNVWLYYHKHKILMCVILTVVSLCLEITWKSKKVLCVLGFFYQCFQLLLKHKKRFFRIYYFKSIRDK